MSKLLSDPTPLQAVVWPLLRTNRDVVVIAEHGCGKTLAYAVPLLVRAAALQGPNFDGIKRFNACSEGGDQPLQPHATVIISWVCPPQKKNFLKVGIFQNEPWSLYPCGRLPP